MFKYSEEVFSPEELLAMIFNSSQQAAQDYAGTYKSVYLVDECFVKNLLFLKDNFNLLQLVIYSALL